MMVMGFLDLKTEVCRGEEVAQYEKFDLSVAVDVSDKMEANSGC